MQEPIQSSLKLRGITILILQVFSLFAESQNLKKGELLPDIPIENVFNYKTNNLRLSDFKGKLILLDFWGPSCISCIESFPEMDSLQQYFNGQIQIILVNRESKDSTEKFFSKRKKIVIPSLPFITDDTLLNEMFPHYGLPFNVWIDKDGKLLYTSDAYYTNKKNIALVLSGHDISLPKETVNCYVPSLFDTKWSHLLQSYSYISRCNEELHIESPISDNGHKILTCNCCTPVQLYQVAFEGLSKKKYSFLKPGRVLFISRDPERFVPPDDHEYFSSWLEQNTYNYQIKLPEEKADDIYKVMKADLDRYFMFNASIELRKVKFLALVRKDSRERLRSKGESPADNFFRRGIRSTRFDSIRYFINKPFSLFVSRLGAYIETDLKKPFVDLTKYRRNVDIKITGKTLDDLSIPDLRKELGVYGLDIIDKRMRVKVLIVKEK